MSKLLPVGYFHTVFTIPQELNTLVLQNQKLLYSILIQSAGHTLMELAKDTKFRLFTEEICLVDRWR